MKLYVKKGRKYQEALAAEIFLAALEIMEGHDRLKGVAEHVKLEMLFGKVRFPDSEGEQGSGT
jgi:hypothetical protein